MLRNSQRPTDFYGHPLFCNGLQVLKIVTGNTSIAGNVGSLLVSALPSHFVIYVLAVISTSVLAKLRSLSPEL